MSSGLAKLLDKSFVLGYALPSLIFLTLMATVFGCPAAICGDNPLQNPFAKLTYAVLAVYILAVFLLAINYWIYRFFEGYLVPIKWFSALTRFHQSRLVQRQAEVKTLVDSGSGDANVLQWRLQRDYPSSPGDVLPTGFGNAIRAFELYSYDIYGVDAIGAWPRLLAVIPKGFQSIINDAKALVDLWINLAGLALTLGVLSLIFAGVSSIVHVTIGFPNGAYWIAIALSSFAFSYITYLVATSLVWAWGEQVRSAFDCFLPDLASKLGYQMPTNNGARSKIWEDLNNQVLYGVAFKRPPYGKSHKHST